MDADERTEQGQDLIVLALNTRVSAGHHRNVVAGNDGVVVRSWTFKRACELAC